ncbi:hypothetical protein BDV23DRAFT_184501 [Aspergillus alliaceus]|uniref:BZIP domain-containing protein n=1 Tax=Petromyces alliaceus TaxID=209559 RepID=A0A5N7C6T2_PETAA|nr:hypothetical protein BDV23DRAFT_184501 [Aspergillus alliaceus]
MDGQQENGVATKSSTIRLEHMPQQAWVWAPGDDWTGVIDRSERRKLQNRHNQRAYRLRRKGKAIERQEAPFTSFASEEVSDVALFTPSVDSVAESTEELKCTHAPPYALQFRRWFEAKARDSYLRGSPRLEHLISLSRLNVHRAIIENISAIGMTDDWMKSDDSISIFNLVHPGFSEEKIPPSLRPTLIQRTIPHHPWLDFFPFPRMRDNLIAAGNTLDDDDLCHDLMAFWDTRNTGATLLVWGEPWDPKNWEVTEGFCKKWGTMLWGCSELLVSTNCWRMRRWEKPLAWRQLLQS